MEPPQCPLLLVKRTLGETPKRVPLQQVGVATARLPTLACALRTSRALAPNGIVVASGSWMGLDGASSQNTPGGSRNEIWIKPPASPAKTASPSQIAQSAS